MRNLVGGANDKGDVGVLRLAQGRGQANGNRVHLGEFGKIGAGPEVAVLDQGHQHTVRHVLNVALAGV